MFLIGVVGNNRKKSSCKLVIIEWSDKVLIELYIWLFVDNSNLKAHYRFNSKAQKNNQLKIIQTILIKYKYTFKKNLKQTFVKEDHTYFYLHMTIMHVFTDDWPVCIRLEKCQKLKTIDKIYTVLTKRHTKWHILYITTLTSHITNTLVGIVY